MERPLTVSQEYYLQPPFPQDSPERGGVILRDGTTATVRPVQADDFELLSAFVQRVSPEARSRRFFGAVSSDAAARQLLKQGPVDERLALLVLTGDPKAPRVVAHAEYDRGSADATHAEVAFIVDDAYKGKGLATLLLERLALVAARQGIRVFTAETEAHNQAMRDVFGSSGFDIREERELGYVLLEFPIAASEQQIERAEMRERIATVASLRSFFRPSSLAVVGVSRDPLSIGRRVLANVLAGGYEGAVYPINPHVETLDGLKIWADVSALPEAAELAVISTPVEAIPAIVDACGERGIRSLIIVSSGFDHPGRGPKLSRRALQAQIRGHGMRLIGPGALGLISTPASLNASFFSGFPLPGSLAMASQSGALGVLALELSHALKLGISHFVSLGSKADVSGNDLLQYWEDDPETALIVLYLESFGNPRRFARLARRIGRKKPILVVKAGRSTEGQRAAASHTAALASSETATRALFHQTGVIRADTLEEMFDVATLLSCGAIPSGPGIAVLSNAGGPAILAVDTLITRGLEVPELAEETRRGLVAISPEFAAQNPLDIGATAEAEGFAQAIPALLADERIDALLVIFVAVGFASAGALSAVLDEAKRTAEANGNPKPIVACFMNADLRKGLHGGIPYFRFPEPAARALARVQRYRSWQSSPPGKIPDPAGMSLTALRGLLREARPDRTGLVSRAMFVDILKAMGLVYAGTEPPPETQGRVVQALRVEVTSDPLFGPVLALGLGGEAMEVMDDLSFRITPITDEDADDMLRGLRGYPLLTGYGGRDEADVEAVKDVLFRVSRLVEAFPDIGELELHPVQVFEKGRGYAILDGRLSLNPGERP